MLRAFHTLAPFALVGCLANTGDEGMIIRNNTAVAVGLTACMFTGDPAQPFISSGEISAKSPVGYFFTPLLQSRLVAIMGQEAEKTISLEGARVSLTATPAVSFPMAQYTKLFSGTLPPGGSANVGFELIPTAAIAAAAAVGPNVEIAATITPYGKAGGSEVTGQPFTYPVNVCANCIVVDHGACPLTGAAIRLGNPCNPYQDGIVDCCSSNGVEVCPGM